MSRYRSIIFIHIDPDKGPATPKSPSFSFSRSFSHSVAVGSDAFNSAAMPALARDFGRRTERSGARALTFLL